MGRILLPVPDSAVIAMSSKPKTSTLTIEEAVARMVSFEYLPEGFTVLDMTSAYLEDANEDHENALRGNRERQAICANVCEARHALAEALTTAIEYEMERGAESELVSSNDPDGVKRLTTESLSQWAGYHFGIAAPEWEPWYQISAQSDTDTNASSLRWEDVTIKIYADHQIGCLWGNGKMKRMSFIDLGLKGKRKNEPNHLGLILIGLSQGKKFPRQKIVEPKDKTAVSRLRRSLTMLTGLVDDPFRPYNEADGWRPRFRLFDDRRNADDRAKARAQRTEFDESRHAPEAHDFKDECDAAADWLQERGVKE